MFLAARLTPEWRYALIFLVLGAALRFTALGSNPPGLFRDEAEKIHTAWTLAKGGGYQSLAFASPEGRPLFVWQPLRPLIDAYGSWTSPIYPLAAAPLAAAFGPNAWTARLPAAVVGLLTLLLLWRWARRAFDSETALLALFFLAISPWHTLFSRWAQQGIFVPLWLTIALLLFERGRTAAGRGWWLAGVAFGLALISYSPMRLTVPLLLIAFILVHRQDLQRNRRAALLAVLAFLVTVAPTAIWLALNRDEGLARWSNVNLWQEGSTPLSVAQQFLSNYLSHLSLPFLFLHGDENLRHSVTGFGQLHWIELPGLVIGLLLALSLRRPQDLTMALWFLLAPIAPSVTLESPHALRGIAALPAAHVLSAVGTAGLFRGLVRGSTEPLRRPRSRLSDVQEWIQVNIEGLRAVAIVAAGVTVLVFALKLTLIYPHRSAPDWEAGLHEALREVAPRGEQGRPIFVTGRVLYLPAHIAVALPRDPPVFGEVEPYLQPPWSQCGEGATSPAALWQIWGEDGRSSVFLVAPGEIRGHEPDAVILGPSSRFTAGPAVLWEIHEGGSGQSALESQ